MKSKASLFHALVERAKSHTKPKARQPRRRELQMETLEERVLLSVAPPQPVATPLPAHNAHAAALALSHAPAAASPDAPTAPPAAAAPQTSQTTPPAHPNSVVTASWIGGDGFWDVASNWSTGVVPDANTDVTIDPAGGPLTIIIRIGSTAKTLQCAENLQINAGGLTLTGAGSSTISGDLILGSNLSSAGPLTLSGTTTWIGSGFFGTGTVTNTGTLTKATGNFGVSANLTNTGTLNFGSGQVAIAAGKAITNQAGGVLNLSSDFSNGGTGTIVNAGTLNCTGGTPAIGTVLSNTGTIHVQSGTLILRNGGTSSGIMNVDFGATLQWLNGTGTGTFLLNTGAQTNGPGTYLVSNFGDVAVAAGHTVTFLNLQIESSSQIGGDGDIIIPDQGVVTWGGVFYGTGRTTIQLGGVANTPDSSAPSLESHVMDLYGTINLNNAALNLHNASTLNIQVGGVVNLNGSASITGPSASVLNILGTLNGSADAVGGLHGPITNAIGAALAGPTVSLAGKLHVTSGNLAITGPLTGAGTFFADLGAGISFDGFFTTYPMTPGTAWDGPGHYYIDTNTTVSLGAGVAITVQDLQVNGTLASAGNLTIAPNGKLTFPNGAIMQGPGTTTLSTGATATGSNLTLTDARIFTNSGKFSAQFITTGSALNSTINNNGTLNIAPPAGQTFASISARLLFNNFGTVNFTGGTAGASFDSLLSNAGTISVLGGEVTIQQLNTVGSSTSTGTFNAATGATISFFSGYTFNAGTQWTGAGTFNFVSGIYNFTTGVTFSPPHATLGNATFSGTGAIAVPAGTSWTGGFSTVKNLAAFTVGSGATLALGGAMTFDNVPVTNNGLITVTDNGAQFTFKNGTTFNNAATGELRFVGLTTGGGFVNSSNSTFTNNGLLRNASSAGTFSIFGITFSNPGTLETDGGNFTIFGTLAQVSLDKTMLLAGTWIVLGGTLKINDLQTQDFFGNPLVTAVENDADVTISGVGSHFNALDNLATNAGHLAILNGATLDIHAYVEDPGPVDPQGPIPGPLTNSGTLEIGANAAVNVGTDYTQTSAGKLTIHLSDTAANNGGGMLHVANTANLDGTLAVALDGGFAPVSGDDYSIATFTTRVGDFANFNGVQPLFDIQATATGYKLHTTGSQADLTPTAATITTTGVVGDNITVDYTVLNQANFGTSATSWTDSIFLSPTAIFDAATAILLGRVAHTGAVAANTPYNGSLTTPLPALTSGAYYVIVLADSRGLVADSNRTNNRFTAATTVNATVPTLTVGTPLNGTIAGSQTRVYQVTLPAGVTRIALDTAAIGAAELLVRNSAGEQFAFDATSDTQALLIDVTTPGDYFVELHGTALAGAGTNFSLIAAALAFSLDSNSPIAATNNGEVTLTIRGAQFTAATAFSLVPSTGSALTPTRTVVRDATTAFVTFDLAGVTPGAFDVQAVDGAAQSTLPAAFNVLAAPVLSTGVEISLTVTGPSGFRVGRAVTLLVTYRNTTGVDQPAPLLIMNSDNGSFGFPDGVGFLEDYVTFFALNTSGGDPGVLPPGYSGTQFLKFMPEDQTVGATAHYAVGQVDPDAAVDYAEVTRLLRPATFSDAQWAPVLAQLQVQLGATYGTCARKLAADAHLLPDDFSEVREPVELLGLELEDALAATGTSMRGIAQGVAIAGSSVTAINQDTGEVFTTEARTDGSFVFGSVTPGSYQLQVDNALVTSGGAVAVTAGQHVTGLVLGLSEGHALNGTVTAQSGGTAIAGAQIDITSADGTTYQAFTDATGKYSIAGLGDGPYELVVTADGRAQAVMDNVAGPVANFVLANESRISGTIALGNGGPADGTLVVTAFPQGSTDPFGFVVNSTDTSFSLGGLPAGTYTVTLTRDGYVTATLSNVVVAAGATTDLGSIPLTASASVSGLVTSNVPGLSAAGLSVTATLGGQVVAIAQTDTNGNYVLSGLAPGNYVIDVTSANSFHTPANLALVAGQTATGTNFTLQSGGSITGQATMAFTGSILPGLTVIAVGADGRTFTAVTDTNGRYAFTGLPLGTYRVALQSVGNATSASVTLSQFGDPAAQVDLTAQVSAQLNGQLEAGGIPVPGGRVSLLQNGRVVGFTSADDNGNYRFIIAAGGTFDIVAAAPGVSFDIASGVLITPLSVVVHDFTAGTGSLQINVTDTLDGTAGDSLTLRQVTTGELIAQVTLGATGVVNFAHLAPGDYDIQVDGSGRSAQTTVTVPAGSAASANLSETTSGSLTGQVATVGGSGVLKNAIVQLYPANGDNPFVAPILADGSYQFPTLPPGTYTAIAFGDGYQAQVLSNVTVTSGSTANFSLAASTSQITGVVQDGNGVPLANMTVVALGSDNRVLGYNQTDANGHFAITSAVGSGLQVSVIPVDSFALAFPGTVNIGANETKDVGTIAYVFTATGVLRNFGVPGLPQVPAAPSVANPAAGVTYPDSGPPDSLIRALERKELKIDLQVAPPANDCEATCMKAYQNALDKIAAADKAFKTVEKLEDLLHYQALVTLNAFAVEVTPLFLLAGAAIGALPPVAVALEAYGVTATVAAGVGSLIGMVNTLNTMLTQSQASDAADVTLNFSNFAQQGADAFGKAIEAVLQADAKETKGFFGGVGAVGLVISGLQTVKSAFAGTLFQQTEEGLRIVGQVDKGVDQALEKYYKAVSEADGAIADYNRCKSNAAVGNSDCQRPPPPPRKPVLVIPIPAIPPLTGGGSISISFDPNDIVGPGGSGGAHFVPAKQALPYTIEFENQASATAPAAVVTVTQQLDSDLDLSTFQLTGYGFGTSEFTIPAGHPSYSTRLDLTATRGILLDVNADLNLATGLLTWTFTSIDPATGDIPDDPQLGFLPPDADGVQGTGFVSYVVQPKATAHTGDVVDAQASIVFDANAPLLTPAIFNTIDAVAPTAQISALPAQSGPDFTVQWSGADDFGGSGLASYDVFASKDHGTFTPLLLDTTQTAAVFTGEVGHNYQFFVRARDFAGNAQAAPAALPDTSIDIMAATELTFNSQHSLSFLDQDGQKVSVKLTGPGSGKVTLLYGAASNADLRSLVLTGTANQSTLKITVTGGGSTTIGRIDGALKSLILGPGVTLGDGLDDHAADLTLHGMLQSLKFANIANFAELSIGEDLTDAATAKLHPTFIAGDLGQHVSLASTGGFGAITVHSWASFGLLNARQSVTSLGIATSDLFGATIDLDSAHLAAGTAKLGPVTVGGALQATFINVEGGIAKITAGGLLGSVINAGGALGNVTVNLKKQTADISGVDSSSVTATSIGNITANVSGLAGLHFARGIENSIFNATTGNIGNISASVSGPELADGRAIDFTVFTAPQGSIGNVFASAKSAAATTDLAAIRETDFYAGINVGNVSALAIASSAAPAAGQAAAFASGDDRDVTITTVAGHIGSIVATAQGAADSNRVFATDPATRIRVNAGTSIGALTFTANKGAATNSQTLIGDAADFFAGKNIGAVLLTGKATANQGSDLIFYAGGKIASFNVTATDPTLGTLSNSLIDAGQTTAIAKNSDLTKAALGAFTLTGSLLNSAVVANGNLGALTIGGDATHDYFVAGVDVGDDTHFLTGDDTYNRAASIASLSVGGMFAADTVAAGVNPGGLFLFGDADDTLAPAIAGVTATAKIGPVKLGASTVPVSATTAFAGPVTIDHTDAIEAPHLTSIRIAGRPLFHDFTSPVWIDGNGDGTEDASEVVVRTLQ